MTGSSSMENYYTYILASKRNGIFYTGVTNNLVRRVFEHKNEIIKGFTSEHEVKMLVYYEIHENIEIAINREKLIKKWKRSIKMDAIERTNPDWQDLYYDIINWLSWLDPVIRRGDDTPSLLTQS